MGVVEGQGESKRQVEKEWEREGRRGRETDLGLHITPP
jgi:hypothetical protein